MAEFLIYNTDHWMDSVPLEKREKWNSIMLAKYDARYRKGDIVEVYSDGRCTEKPSPNSKFVVIKVPGLSFKDAKHLMDADLKLTDTMETVENPKGEDIVYIATKIEILKRRQYHIDSTVINIPSKELSISKTTFQSSIVDKTFG